MDPHEHSGGFPSPGGMKDFCVDLDIFTVIQAWLGRWFGFIWRKEGRTFRSCLPSPLLHGAQHEASSAGGFCPPGDEGRMLSIFEMEKSIPQTGACPCSWGLSQTHTSQACSGSALLSPVLTTGWEQAWLLSEYSMDL